MEQKIVWIFLADGFEEIEAIATIDVLRRAEIEVRTVAVGSSTLQIKGAHGVAVMADCAIHELKDTDLESQPSMIVLPGGMPGAQNLADSDEVRFWIQRQNERQASIAAICAAPFVLAEAGIDTPDIEVTCYPGFESRIGRFNHFKASLVESKHIITAEGPAFAIDFALAIVSALRGEEVADQVAQGMLYRA